MFFRGLSGTLLVALVLTGCGKEHVVSVDGGPNVPPNVTPPTSNDGWAVVDGGYPDPPDFRPLPPLRDGYLPPPPPPPLFDAGVPTSCGPFPGGQCPGGMVCDVQSCYPGASGQCLPKVKCPPIWAPACGCDGVTYTNDCFRVAYGVALSHAGTCATSQDGGILPPPPPPPPPPTDGGTKVCGPMFPGGQCGYAEVCNVLSCYPGATGTCLSKPSSCPKLWAPVCGCDGVTYPNECYRLLAGVPQQHSGACAIVAPDAGVSPPMKCLPGMCGPGLVCDVKGCGNPGMCVAKPVNCPFLWAPVCGCNGQTYANDCIRLLAEEELMHPGSCNQDGGP